MDRPGVSGDVFTLEFKEAWWAICADPYVVVSEPVHKNGVWTYTVRRV